MTTLDIDFMFRKTAANLQKLKGLARDMGASILKAYYSVSDLYRVVKDDQGLQLDFMGRLDGVRSFEGLRSRAGRVEFGQASLLVASLSDIIASKRAAGRPRDLAVLDILEKTFEEQEQSKKRLSGA